MTYLLLPIAATLFVLQTLSAHAACVYRPFEFHPEKNDGVIVDVIVDAGSSCTHNFGGGRATPSRAILSSPSRRTANW